jgi:ribosome-binding factor A
MKGPNDHFNDRLKEQILHGVNQYLRGLSDVRLKFVSITKVELNKDFSVATLHWDTFDSNTRGDAKRSLEGARGKLRTHLAQTLKLRHTPDLRMVYDAQFVAQNEIEQLLEKDLKSREAGGEEE